MNNSNMDNLFGAREDRRAKERQAKIEAQKAKAKRDGMIILAVVVVIIAVIAFAMLTQEDMYPYDVSQEDLTTFFYENQEIISIVQNQMKATAVSDLQVKYLNDDVFLFEGVTQLDNETISEEHLDNYRDYFKLCEKVDLRGATLRYIVREDSTRFDFFFYLTDSRQLGARAGIMNSVEPPSVKVTDGNFSGAIGNNWFYYRYGLSPSPDGTVTTLPWIEG